MVTHRITRPPPPPWATRSVAEDAGITHETVSSVHPRALSTWPPQDRTQRAVEVSISVVDQFRGDRWVRSGPTVQVEGGAYPLSQVAELIRALLDVSGLPN
jgi:hypothetical protein